MLERQGWFYLSCSRIVRHDSFKNLLTPFNSFIKIVHTYLYCEKTLNYLNFRYFIRNLMIFIRKNQIKIDIIFKKMCLIYGNIKINSQDDTTNNMNKMCCNVFKNSF